VDIKEYISGGIVESYVLGLATEQERAEFEKLSLEYPELVQARLAFERVLEVQAIENAIDPPVSARNSLMKRLNFTGDQKQTTLVKHLPGNNNWWKYAAAACLVLLAASLYWNISLYNKNKKLDADYTEKIAKLNEMKEDMHVLQNPGIKMATMKGMDASPQSFATVYWDTTSHDVYLLANNLPRPASDKQYQLWAIFKGKPVDLGVFDIKEERLLIRAKNAQGAEAFAITLEKKGGSPEGPKGDMYVMGNL
jgi:anti-sigma-K factor RskA